MNRQPETAALAINENTFAWEVWWLDILELNTEIYLLKLKIEKFLKEKWITVKEFLEKLPENLKTTYEQIFLAEESTQDRFKNYEEKSPNLLSFFAEASQAFKEKMSKVFEKINFEAIWEKAYEALRFVISIPAKILEVVPNKIILVAVFLSIIYWWPYIALEFLKTWAAISASAGFDALSTLMDIDFTTFNEMIPDIVKVLSSWTDWLPAV